MSELNDPRVLFAAERTLLAWNRTSIALIAFGYVIERSALFADALLSQAPHAGRAAVWIGVSFIVLGALLAVLSVFQYRIVLRSLRPVEIPKGYLVNLAAWVNVVIGVLGVLMALYLVFGMPGA